MIKSITNKTIMTIKLTYAVKPLILLISGGTDGVEFAVLFTLSVAVEDILSIRICRG